MDDKDEKPREGNEASRPEVKSPGFVSGEGTKKVPKDKPKPYDPWAKATTTAGELSGVSPGYVYSVLCPRDFRGSALEDARKKLISDGYERDEQAFSPHMPDAEAWRKPQALVDEQWRVKLFDLTRRRDYAEHLLAHEDGVEPWFRDVVFGFHKMRGARKRSLTELQKACKAYPVHRDNTPRF